MKEEDLKRIIHYHLAPINISVQATNPELRCKMLHNRFAGDILDKIKMLADADIEMNAQIVLCKGENDGAELDRSIGDLLSFYPQMQSMSVVPVERGCTRWNLLKEKKRVKCLLPSTNGRTSVLKSTAHILCRHRMNGI